MSDDIVARLRGIEGGYNLRNLFHQAADEIERLRAALDAARMEMCMVRAPSTNASDDTEHAMREYARSRGWDCFRGMEDEP